MQDSEKLDVVFVGAHPDDVEIGCGGTIVELVRQGYRVGIIDLTDGEPTPESPGPDVRLAEARQAAQVLGVAYRNILPFTNRRLFDSFESRVALAIEFRRFKPEIVIGIAGRTPMASPDHWQAAQITDAAVFYSRLTKWDEHFQGLPVHRIDRQLHYHLSFDPSLHPEFGHSFIHDISGSLERKMESVRCYATQFPPSKAGTLSRLENLARTLGGSAGYSAGERFYSLAPLGTRNLVQFTRN